MRHPVAVVAGLFVSMVAAPMLIALACELLRRRWLRRGGLTVGMVVECRSERVTVGPPTWLVRDVRYSVVRYTDRAGGEHTLRAQELPVGEYLRVVYNPRRPHRAIAGKDEEIVPLAVGGACAALLAAGLLVWGW
ncbi:DUF3592 domain-containing protein [Actinomadura rupiterrae]|uniref:DUF3592 domain-containing protein n=1 Tax=Actinomadura rupiterrae TaxID=559627 RepID=UPI0020A25BBE|nr:DUF3592 domain-containing protein [Actinomadura rupiterrae]MCP2336464.1 hypothetical protein [Actinomadura rupiterrae]